MRMTWRVLILMTMMTFISFITMAQVAIGFKGGLNYSNFSEPATNFKPSFHGGLELQYMFSNSFGIESGLYYSGLGASKNLDIKDSEGQTIGTDKKTFKSDNLQIPLLFLYKFNIGNDVLMCPFVGGYGSYGTGGKTKTTTYIFSSSSETEHFDNFFGGFSSAERIDAGASIGLNFEFENYYTKSTYQKNTNKIILGVSYERGLMEVNCSDSYLSAYSKKFNQNIKLSMGILF